VTDSRTMFRVTPVPENRDRKVSFSPDIDESYRHRVVDKIQGLMKEVEVIHKREETHMQKQQEAGAFDFKRKQELELQAFMKRQKEEASGFHSNQTTDWNNLKEKHTQETWKLFGRSSSRPDSTRPTIHNMWGEQNKTIESAQSSPCFSPVGGNNSASSWSSNNSQVASPNSWQTSNPWEPKSAWDPTGGRASGAQPANNSMDYWSSQ